MKTFKIISKTIVPILLAAATLASPQLWAARSRPDFNLACDSIRMAGKPFVRGANCRIAVVDGFPREYVVYVPPAIKFKKAPVIFFFHGSGGGAEFAFLNSGWREKADEEGLIAVFGSALPYVELDTGEFKTKWNNFNLVAGVDLSIKPPGYPADAPWPADDVAFTDIMLADVASGLLVDDRRIYINGFSNGGGMALRLAVERSGVFAAAAVAGPGALSESYSSPRQMPLYYAIGNRDGHLVDSINNAPDAPVPPITQAPIGFDELFAFSPVQYRFATITETFGVPNEPDHIWEFENELHIRYRAIPRGNEVTVSIQAGVTHEYPNGNDNPNGFDDTEIFWKFFHDNPLPK